jgi:hypothetical protein
MAKITVQEEAAAPSTPPSGQWHIYTKSDGLYVKDDAGNEIGPFVSSTGGISDGDKGDIAVSIGGTVWTIDNGVVTLAKLVDATGQYKILARASSGAGDWEELTSSANVFSLLGAADYAAIRTLLGLVIGTNVQAWDADLDALATKSLSGNGTVLGTVTGLLTTGKQLAFDASGNIIASASDIGGGGGGVPDGDKGDITVSSSATVWTIDNNVVTFAKIQDITDARLLGRSAGSDGDMQHIAVGTGLTLSGGNLTGATASDTVVGVVELATTAETNTGTDATRAVTPDGLAGSYAGTASVSSLVQSGTITTGDGKIYILMPAKVNGMNLVGVACTVQTPSSSGTLTVQVARGRQANATTAHAYVDMLSTRVTIDANEYSSANPASAAVINTSNDDIATGDLLRVDIDVTGTGPANLYIYLEFRLP